MPLGNNSDNEVDKVAIQDQTAGVRYVLVRKRVTGLAEAGLTSYFCTPNQTERGSRHGRHPSSEEKKLRRCLQRAKNGLPLHPASTGGGQQSRAKKNFKKFLRKLANRNKLLTFATPNGTPLGKHKKEAVVTATTGLIQQELAHVL
jgi:hypothetical protein